MKRQRLIAAAALVAAFCSSGCAIVRTHSRMSDGSTTKTFALIPPFAKIDAELLEAYMDYRSFDETGVLESEGQIRAGAEGLAADYAEGPVNAFGQLLDMARLFQAMQTGGAIAPRPAPAAPAAPVAVPLPRPPPPVVVPPAALPPVAVPPCE